VSLAHRMLTQMGAIDLNVGLDSGQLNGRIALSGTAAEKPLTSQRAPLRRLKILKFWIVDG
jgi:hypothetical protein